MPWDLIEILLCIINWLFAWEWLRKCFQLPHFVSVLFC